LFQKVEADMIGTPDPISNLRPVKYFVAANETPEVETISLQGWYPFIQLAYSPFVVFSGNGVAVTSSARRPIQWGLLEF
jgi:hypothetical protein